MAPAKRPALAQPPRSHLSPAEHHCNSLLLAFLHVIFNTRLYERGQCGPAPATHKEGVTRMKLLLMLACTAGLAGSAMAQNSIGMGLVILHPTAESAFRMQGNADFRIEGSGVYVNSNHLQAVTAQGAVTLDAPFIYTRGGVQMGGNFTFTGQLQGSNWCEDPLAGLEFPSHTAPGVTVRGAMNISGRTTVMLPANSYWSGGISISGSNADVTFAPGIHYIGGSGLSASGGRIVGDGVLLIMVEGSLSLTGGIELMLRSGDNGMANIVIAQARNNSSQMQLAGGSNFLVLGTIYSPAAHVRLGGSSSSGQGPQMGHLVVANTLELHGGGRMRVGDNNLQTIQLMMSPMWD
jgi:hypothetical protein